MRTTKAPHRESSTDFEAGLDVFEEHEALEIYRVLCPECDQRIALLADEERLPEHALLPTPREPFGLAVCGGSGAFAADADEVEEEASTERDPGVLLTLPAGLDWRTQPFSHAGRPPSVVPAQSGRR